MMEKLASSLARSAPGAERRAPSAERASVSEPTVSIVVPTHNRAPLLNALLESIGRVAWDPARVEVWIVGDTAIRDDTEQVVAAFARSAPFPVRYLLAPNSPAAKRNAGLQAATGEIVAFTDDDCLVDAQWLRRACEAFADPEVAGVQGQTVVPTAAGNPASYRRTRRLMEPNFQTCNILYRRASLVAAGGFDERFTAAISEDSDLAFSVLESGGEIGYCAEAVVYHPAREDGAWDVLRAARHNYFAPLLYKKHPSLYRRRLGSPVPRAARLYFALDAAAALCFVGGATGLALTALGARALVLGAQIMSYCRGDRSLRRAAATSLSLCVAPYAAYYYLAAGNLRFRSRLWW
jgi:cellulose synthase/poly-beta-1,6-N-acetylglucosamine synthase-like glycosyltransferase